MKTEAQQLADKTLAEFDGDFSKALAELKYSLGPEGCPENETVLDAIADLKKLRSQIIYKR